MITCQACGAQNPPEAAYCSNCARKLDSETQQAVAAQRAGHTATGINWTAVIIAIVLALVIILVVGLVLAHVL